MKALLSVIVWFAAFMLACAGLIRLIDRLSRDVQFDLFLVWAGACVFVLGRMFFRK